ncbi:MAG: tyrosine protein phosphatase [Lactobacillales bacterium]|nr:tyrosine protein phosphatase [Lactobacillales bacterium]
MIDLHCHILPGVDDGAQTLDDSLKMAKKAAKDGITHILCTPHHNMKYSNPKEKVLVAVSDLQKELDEENIPITLFEGQEVRIHHQLMDEIDSDVILFADVNDRYLMLEFPTAHIPEYTDKMLSDMLERGIVPVIVHPERYTEIQENPNLLVNYLNMGCLAQVTAPSVVGKYGSKVKKLSHLLIKNNLVQMVASDAHRLGDRNFYLKEAFKVIEKKYGDEKTQYFTDVARSVINGDDIQVKRYRAL